MPGIALRACACPNDFWLLLLLLLLLLLIVVLVLVLVLLLLLVVVVDDDVAVVVFVVGYLLIYWPCPRVVVVAVCRAPCVVRAAAEECIQYACHCVHLLSGTPFYA